MQFRWIELCACGVPYVWMHELPEEWEAYLKKNGHGYTYSIRVEVRGVQPGDSRYDPSRHVMHYPRCTINPLNSQQSRRGR